MGSATTSQATEGTEIMNGKSRKKIIVSLLGPAVLREKPASNEDAVERVKQHWTQQMSPVLPDRPDLIVIPEACDRFVGHTMDERKAYYEFRGDKIRDFFSSVAKENNCYIACSAARRLPDGTYRNSTQLIDRQGQIAGIYNKNHLVPVETTKGGMLCGKDAPVFQTDFGTVAMAICFDLNFHELLEKYAERSPDLIIFSSMYHGGLMQNYWAYTCRSYFVGAIAGKECTVINPVGEKIARSTDYFKRVTAEINLDFKVVHLDENGGKLDAVKAKYGRGVTMFDPGHVGAVLLTSEMEDVTVDDIINEFQIETWDEYYARSMEHRHTPGNMEP